MLASPNLGLIHGGGAASASKPTDTLLPNEQEASPAMVFFSELMSSPGTAVLLAIILAVAYQLWAKKVRSMTRGTTNHAEPSIRDVTHDKTHGYAARCVFSLLPAPRVRRLEASVSFDVQAWPVLVSARWMSSDDSPDARQSFKRTAIRRLVILTVIGDPRPDRPIHKIPADRQYAIDREADPADFLCLYYTERGRALSNLILACLPALYDSS